MDSDGDEAKNDKTRWWKMVLEDEEEEEDRTLNDESTDGKDIDDKAKEDKAKEDNAKEDKAKVDETKEDKDKEDKDKEDKAKEDKVKEDKAKEDKAKEDKAETVKTKDDNWAKAVSFRLKSEEKKSYGGENEETISFGVGADSGGSESDGAESANAKSGGGESGEVESGDVESGDVESGDVESGDVESGEAEGGEAESGGAEDGGAESNEVEGVETEDGAIESAETEYGKVESSEVDGGEVESDAGTESNEVEGAETEYGNVKGGEVEGGEVEGGGAESGGAESGGVESGGVESSEVESSEVEGGETEDGEIEGAETEYGKVESGKVESDAGTESNEVQGAETEYGKVKGGEAESNEVEGDEADGGKAESGGAEGGGAEGGGAEGGGAEGGGAEGGESDIFNAIKERDELLAAIKERDNSDDFQTFVKELQSEARAAAKANRILNETENLGVVGVDQPGPICLFTYLWTDLFALCHVRGFANFEDHNSIFEFPKDNNEKIILINQKAGKKAKNKRKNQQTQKEEFTFDRVFDNKSKPENVSEVVEGIVEDCFRNINVAVVCYGAPNSGKSCLLKGMKGTRGLIFHVLDKLLTTVSILEKKGFEFVVRVSNWEAFDNKISDLLCVTLGDDWKPHKYKASMKRGKEFYVTNLTEVQITTIEEFAETILPKSVRNGLRALSECTERRSNTDWVFHITLEGVSVTNLEGQFHTIGSSVLFMELCGRRSNTGSKLENFVHMVEARNSDSSWRKSAAIKTLQRMYSTLGNRTILIASVSQEAEHIENTKEVLNFVSTMRDMFITYKANRDESE